MKKYATVDEYIAAQPQEFRALLRNVRRVIRAALPKDAEETMSYGMPAYRYGKGRPVIYFAGFKHHCSIFPGDAATVKKFAAQLKGHATSKGTIQFTPDDPLSDALVRKIVRARLAAKGY